MRFSGYPSLIMKTSVTWLNDYLDPPLSAQQQADLLTDAGFPFDGGDVAAATALLRQKGYEVIAPDNSVQSLPQQSLPPRPLGFRQVVIWAHDEQNHALA